MNKSLNDLIESFSRFPGIGPRQAERFCQFIARSDKEYINSLIRSIKEYKDNVKRCNQCHIQYEGNSVDCEICSSQTRDSLLVIVEKDVDVKNIENSNSLNGKYFVLGGLIPISKDLSNDSRIRSLLQRIKQNNVDEIVIALSSHKDAEHTQLFLKEKIAEVSPVTITVLGKGISTGTEIEYADADTIKNAVINRSEF